MGRASGKFLIDTSLLLIVGGAAILGAIVGSFLSTIIVRWPAGRSVIDGRSHCDQCQISLRYYHLIPVLSYAVQRGRCHSCNGRINPRHITIELGTMCIGALALFLTPGWGGFAGAIFGWTLLTLAVLDVENLWLPDALTLPLAVAGLILGSPELTDRIIGAVAGYTAFEAIRIAYKSLRGRDGLGAGDSKLLAALGAWLGWSALPVVVLGASGAGLAWVILSSLLGKKFQSSDALPFGAFLAVAGFLTWIFAS